MTRLRWRELYDAHASELAGYLWKLTGDREVATELMQDTFILGLRDEGALREPARVRAWLFRIATRLAIKRRRRDRLIAFVPFAGTERSTGGIPDVESLAVRDAMRSISTDQAVALVLHYAHGFTRAEIAALVGRSEEAVKSRIARGRRAFLAAYDRQGGTP
ncbi:MAG TPA: RNA polymerase sigma factor [Candidatus Limnocylindria bacterium]|nr:RNA polymerase sigma factor [Candidatus Limnocylindria bacterium]